MRAGDRACGGRGQLRSAFGAGSLPDEREASVALEALSDGLVAPELGVVELPDGMLLVAAGVVDVS
jgi:hypothetical protein